MSSIRGRWDLIVDTEGTPFPSWLEIGDGTGRFVGKVGSARTLQTVSVEGTTIKFALPRQYEQRTTLLEFNGELIDGVLHGTTTVDDGTSAKWTGIRAAELPTYVPTWGETIELIGSDLSGWLPRSPNWVNNWSIVDDELHNTAVGSDLVTIDTFSDFRLVAEYRYPKGSNSGIYLRGRYEFQIVDDFVTGENGVGNSAAIYGFLAPSRNAILPPDEWNRAEITLIGRWITVVLNGETVIENQEIPGITGGALDSRESEQGPIFVQGDHGPVTFRRLSLTPAKP